MVPSKIRTKQSTIAILHLYWKANTYCKLQPKSWQDTPYLSFQLADCHNRIFFIHLLGNAHYVAIEGEHVAVCPLIYGRRRKYVSFSKRTSLENFIQSLRLLRTKFGAISFEVRLYFERNSPLCTNFGPTSNELPANFVWSSQSTNFAWTHNSRSYHSYTLVLAILSVSVMQAGVLLVQVC